MKFCFSPAGKRERRNGFDGRDGTFGSDARSADAVGHVRRRGGASRAGPQPREFHQLDGEQRWAGQRRTGHPFEPIGKLASPLSTCY